MPLTDIQRRVVHVLQPFRAEYDFIGGGAALNQKWPRLSDDLDIFRDRHRELPDCTKPELEALKAQGFSVEITVENEYTVEAIVRLYGFETKIQWIDDEETSNRFFPAYQDDELGFRLHQADLAVNKVLCASRRRTAPRDTVDLAEITQRYCPLGPLVWAACGKDPSVSPTQMITKIRSISFGYSEEEISTVRMTDGNAVDRASIRDTLDNALEKARSYCEETAPIDFGGHLFVDVQDRPTVAADQNLQDGRARALPLKDYGPDPHLPI